MSFDFMAAGPGLRHVSVPCPQPAPGTPVLAQDFGVSAYFCSDTKEPLDESERGK